MLKTERKLFLIVVFRQQDSTAIPFLNIIKFFIKSLHYFKIFVDITAILQIVTKIKSPHFNINVPNVDNGETACEPVTGNAYYFKLKHSLFEAFKNALNVSKRYCRSSKNAKTDTNRSLIKLGTKIAYSRAKQKKIVQLGLKSSIRAQKPAKKEKRK
jgi:hypothetical protein